MIYKIRFNGFEHRAKLDETVPVVAVQLEAVGTDVRYARTNEAYWLKIEGYDSNDNLHCQIFAQLMPFCPALTDEEDLPLYLSWQ